MTIASVFTTPVPSRRLDLAQDATTGGYYLATLKIGRVFRCAPADFYKAEVYRVASPAILEWGADDFDAVVTQTATTLEIVATAKLDSDVVLTLRARANAEGWEFDPPVVANTSTAYAVRSVVWPGIGFFPFGDDEQFFAACAYGSGYIRRAPHRDTGLVSVCPDNPAFFGLYDSETRACLHAEFRDETYRRKTISSMSNAGTGDGAFVYVEYRHFADRRFAPTSWGSDYDYKLHLTQFTGRTRDARLCAFDHAERYAVWAGDDRRPWNTRGRWKDAAAFPARVRETALHITYSSPFDATNHPVAITRWQTLVGPFAEPLVTHYGWGNKVFDTHNPAMTDAGAVSTAVKNFVIAAQAADWTVLAYWLGRYWETADPTTGFDPAAYVPSGTLPVPDDLRPYMMHKPDGTLRALQQTFETVPVNFAIADWTHRTVWPRALVDVYKKAVVGQFAAFAQPKGVYLDAHGTLLSTSVADGSDLTDQDDDPTDTDWNFPAYYRGYIEAVNALVNVVGIGELGNAIFTEWPSELNVSTVSLMTNNTTFYNLGVGVNFLPCIYGDRLRFTTFGVPVVYNGLTQNLQNSWLIAMEFLSSGIVQINDGTSDVLNTSGDPVLIHAVLAESPLYYMLIWAKKLADFYAAAGRTYFEGRKTLPIVGDWKGAFVAEQNTDPDAGVLAAVSSWIAVGGSQRFIVLSETWRTADGAVGIMFAYPYPAEADIIPAHVGYVPVLAAKTITVVLDTAVDRLVAGSKKVYKNANGTRSAALATFTGTTTLTVAVEPFEVFVLEIVPA